MLHIRIHPLIEKHQETIKTEKEKLSRIAKHQIPEHEHKHGVKKSTFNWSHFPPAFFGILSVIIAPIFFLNKNLAPWAYLITGMSCIFGTITMTHFSFINWKQELSFFQSINKSLLADIIILWAKFAIAASLYEIIIHSKGE
ncbi:MAG: hypothetical protein HYU63_08720 [Armatimonadetes bacterium]|nr:hypothetical protein [Armatimonadota bacterium]